MIKYLHVILFRVAFDLMIIYEDKTLRDITNFVSEKIATQEGVLSLLTSFSRNTKNGMSMTIRIRTTGRRLFYEFDYNGKCLTQCSRCRLLQ